MNIENLQVKTTHVVNIMDIDAPEKVINQLKEMAEQGYDIDSVTEKYSDAIEWLDATIQDSDAMEWAYEVQDIDA